MCYGEVERERVEAEIIPSLHESGSWRSTAVSRRQNKTTFPQDLSLTVAAAGGIVRVVRDITDRKTRERRLCDARRFNEESAENTPFGMFRPDGELRIAYENPRAEKIVGLPGDQKPPDAMGADISDLPPIVETGQAELFETLRHGETIELEFPFELIYRKEACFTGHAVPIYREGEFDGAILTATDISERTQNERNLKRQREQLAALDELNDVVRGITEAAIEQSTRDEIERVVCERPADSDLYRFAWMGVIDPGPRPEPHVEAGVDGYTDDLPFTGRPGDPEPVGDDECLMYGTASDEAMKTITALRERRPAWKGVHTFDDRDGEVWFEQRLSDPPMASIVTGHGRSVDSGRIENGVYSATIRLPPGTNVLLVRPRRQDIPSVVAGQPARLALSELTTDLHRQAPPRRVDDRGRTLQVTLHHVDLPVLAAPGPVACDPDDLTVAPGSRLPECMARPGSRRRSLCGQTIPAATSNAKSRSP
jgi:PAS domain-containing protein